jgi:hypothetical protein
VGVDSRDSMLEEEDISTYAMEQKVYCLKIVKNGTVAGMKRFQSEVNVLKYIRDVIISPSSSDSEGRSGSLVRIEDAFIIESVNVIALEALLGKYVYGAIPKLSYV